MIDNVSTRHHKERTAEWPRKNTRGVKARLVPAAAIANLPQTDCRDDGFATCSAA